MNKVLEQSEHRIMDELVVRARSERDAFGQLYDRIYAPVFRYCIRRTSDRSLAVDITSTVFLNVANNIAAPGEKFLNAATTLVALLNFAWIAAQPKKAPHR